MESKFRIGDKVQLKLGFDINESEGNKNFAGHGYSEAINKNIHILTIAEIESYLGNKYILWFNEIHNGIYCKAIYSKSELRELKINDILK